MAVWIFATVFFLYFLVLGVLIYRGIRWERQYKFYLDLVSAASGEDIVARREWNWRYRNLDKYAPDIWHYCFHWNRSFDSYFPNFNLIDTSVDEEGNDVESYAGEFLRREFGIHVDVDEER